MREMRLALVQDKTKLVAHWYTKVRWCWSLYSVHYVLEQFCTPSIPNTALDLLLPISVKPKRRLLQFLHSTASSCKKFKKYCPDDENEQHFFRYILTLPAVLEKIAAEIVVCSMQGADELKGLGHE